MFTAFGCIDMTFIFNFYHHSMCPAFNIKIQKSERPFRKHKLKTVPKSFKMRYEKNIFPAGWESDEFDEFGDVIESPSYGSYPVEPEDFQLSLKFASINNNVSEITRVLNSETVNINSYLDNSWTALMHAAFNGSLDAVTYLLQNGADPLIEYDCHNVIMCVCNCSSISANELDLLNCLKLLSNFDSIDINAKDRTGLTALMYACSNGRLKLVEFLVDHSADLELKDHQSGETALFFAVRSNHLNVVKFLLSKGADKDATDKKYQTVHRIAEIKNMVDILNVLNMDYKNAQLEVYYSEEEQTYWNEVMTELENGFSKDIKSFLETLSMEIYTDHLVSKNVTFKSLLTGNNDQFVNMGITLSPHRRLLATALKNFHAWGWTNCSLGVKKSDMNAEQIAQTMGIIVRQLYVLDASIKYLGNNSYGLDQQKGREAINLIKRIRTIEREIFKILDQKARISQVDYIGYHKIKNQNIKKNIDNLFASAAVLLVLFRIF